jgi:hypothetical protein
MNQEDWQKSFSAGFLIYAVCRALVPLLTPKELHGRLLVAGAVVGIALGGIVYITPPLRALVFMCSNWLWGIGIVIWLAAKALIKTEGDQ